VSVGVALDYGEPTRCQPDFVMLLATTFVNCVSALKITQKCMLVGIPVIVILTCASRDSDCWSSLTKKMDTPALDRIRGFFSSNLSLDTG